MHVTTLATGIRVNLDAVTFTLTASWSSEDRALQGLPADLIACTATSEALAADGTPMYPVAVVTAVETAGAAARRAKIIPRLRADALLALDALKSTAPQEPLVIAVTGSVQPVRRLRPAFACSPTSNNDEIAKSLVACAATLGKDVQDVFTAYAAKWALSGKRRAGIAAKLQPLGAVVV